MDEPVPVTRKPRYSGPDRRQSDRRSLVTDKNLPVWARIMALVGIPGTIAIFLVWTTSQTLPSLQSELYAMRVENQRLSQLISLNQSRTEENHRLLIRICSAVTKGDERARCFDP